jgi:hypothetical protein
MVYYNSTIILYGGETKKGLVDDNFYRYTIETRQWSIIQISGVKPGFRYFHSMNFFKPDSLIIYGGKFKQNPESTDFLISNDIVYVDLNILDCSTPFIADIGPTQRFGHVSCYNSNFNPCEHLIVGGLDQSFCSMDIYSIKEIEIKDNKKWVYEQQKMHASQKIDGSDEIFETAKKTLISYRKKLEELTKENIQINKKL